LSLRGGVIDCSIITTRFARDSTSTGLAAAAAVAVAVAVAVASIRDVEEPLAFWSPLEPFEALKL